jgi:phage-related protein (TIGR01555 family)
MVEILAKEMTRKWVTLTTGDDADDAKLAPLAKAMKEYRVRAMFRRAFEHDGFFGRGQIYIDTGVDPQNPLSAVEEVITTETPLRFQVVEPYWCYPGFYDADDPLNEWFYKPRSWWVNGKTVAASRMITIVSRELPDILKPVYQFAGLPLTQMAKPYVDNWLTTRQNVNDLVGNFSTMVLKTDMSSVLNGGGGESLLNRIEIFNRYRSNRGTFVADKDSEDLTNVSASLASLDKLQAQAQEHMSSVSGIPLVILLGITPSGLNAASEGEMQAFYSWVAALQEDVLRDPIQRVLDLLQLKTFGEINPAITFQFNPLWEESAEGLALRRKSEADTAAIYLDRGVISPDEERDRLKRDEESAYDLQGDAPEPDPANNPFWEQGEPDGDA